MLIEGGLFALGGLGLWSIYRYESSPTTKFRRQLKDALERSSLQFKFTDKSGTKIAESPTLISIDPIKYGWKVKLRIPVGKTPQDIYDAKAILEGATNSEMVLNYEGQVINLEFYTHKIPEPGSPEALYSEELVREVAKYPLAVPIGYSRQGLLIHDLSKPSAPHLLVGGQTGMGKSNILNLIITTLSKAYTPDQVNIHLIDTKMVEFFKFKNLDHISSCSIDINEGVDRVRQIKEELESRQEILMTSGYGHILDYNRDIKGFGEELPYIVLIIDEFGDFQGITDFWNSISTIARKGRAMGIHAILSTQRPDANTLPPKVKANLAGVVCLKTKTKSNSQILLDSPRAFHLPLKQGRALFQLDGLREVQIPYIDEETLEKELGIFINKKFRRDNDDLIILDPDDSSVDKSNVIDITPSTGTFRRIEPNRLEKPSKVSNSLIVNPNPTKKSYKATSRMDTADIIKSIEKVEIEALKINKNMNDLGKKVIDTYEKYTKDNNDLNKIKLSKQGSQMKKDYEIMRTQRDDLLLKSMQLRKLLNVK